MFIRTLEGLAASGLVKSLVNGTFRSARFLTAADGMGFSYNDNHVTRGTNATLWLKHHWEANHILSGTGQVTDLTTGESWKLQPGMAYNVGPRDRHTVRAQSDLHLLSIFNPPLRGDEQHDKEGTLPPSGPVPPGPRDR